MGDPDGGRARRERATPTEEMQRAKAAVKQDFLDGSDGSTNRPKEGKMDLFLLVGPG